VTATRQAGRPGLRDALPPESVTWLAGGTGAGAAGSPLVLGVARIGAHRCVIVGQDRSAAPGRRLGPAALRRARRGLRLAASLRLPLVTFIDTAGAELSVAAEEGGLAFEIGQCVEAMLGLPVPAVAVLLGQGAGGGAIALAAADRLIALELSWLAPLAPEGASAIVYGHPGRAAELARDQQVVAADLLDRGIADLVLPEHDAFPAGIGAAVAAALDELTGLATPALAARRYERFRRLASPSPRA
jgi:acetyl-CoA carboxylase carboxyl transferase subunit beta